MTIPRIFSENYNRTSAELSRTEGLMDALETLADYAEFDWSTKDANALYSLITAVRGQLQAVRKAHSMEWAGFGGVPEPDLTPEEIAIALGQPEPR